MMAGESLESLELGMEAIGVIFHSLGDLHEKYFVQAVEVTPSLVGLPKIL